MKFPISYMCVQRSWCHDECRLSLMCDYAHQILSSMQQMTIKPFSHKSHLTPPYTPLCKKIFWGCKYVSLNGFVWTFLIIYQLVSLSLFKNKNKKRPHLLKPLSLSILSFCYQWQKSLVLDLNFYFSRSSENFQEIQLSIKSN